MKYFQHIEHSVPVIVVELPVNSVALRLGNIQIKF